MSSHLAGTLVDLRCHPEDVKFYVSYFNVHNVISVINLTCFLVTEVSGHNRESSMLSRPIKY